MHITLLIICDKFSFFMCVMCMKVSIITVCFDSCNTIQDTFTSVANQDYGDIEYIVVDGGSKDGTLEIIKSNTQWITKYISEPDDGLYDAMNKGLKLATGNVIGFINSDDILDHGSCISEIVDVFNATNTDIVYGDNVYVNPNDVSKVERYWRSGYFEVNSYKKGWVPPHPATYIKRSAYQKFGNFNTEFKISADYELMLRFIFGNRLYPVYLPKVITRMRTGGLSNRSVKNIIISNIEAYKSFKINSLDVSIWIILLKPLRKVKQYLAKPISDSGAS